MRITAVNTAIVEANYDWTYIRVDTDEDGLSGLGESFTAPGLTAIIRDLAPLLVGEPRTDVDRLWSKLRWGASAAGPRGASAGCDRAAADASAGSVSRVISVSGAALWALVGPQRW